jgi:uncharacterized protein DUF1353
MTKSNKELQWPMTATGGGVALERQLGTVSKLKMGKFVTLLMAAGFLAGCGSTPSLSWRDAAIQSHPWGYYTGAPETRWNPDGRTMTLLRELRYVDPQGTVWIAPAGSVVDGASIPRSLWPFMGGPFEGKYRNASVLHDVSYTEKNRPPKDCDRMFYNAMRCSGVSALEAKTMYYALLRFGWHWDFSIKRAKPVKIGRKLVARAESAETAAENEHEIEGARDWIRQSAPTIEEIEQMAGTGMR